MALSTLLLPSSSTTTERRRAQQPPQQQNHHSKRKKKPPSQPPPLSPAPRTPGRRHLATGTPCRKSPALAAPATGAKARLVAGKDHHGRHRRSGSSSKKVPARPASSWEQLKSLLSCRSATAAARVHDPAAHGAGGYWGTSLCSMRDVATVDGASSAASVVVDHRDTAPLNRSSRRAHHSSSSSAGGGGGHPSSLRGLSGCYECRAINVEPVSRRYPRPRELCPCSQCGEVFTKADSLEQHQAVRHAVSELGPEDSGRNIVEIIFKSSWQKRDRPICHIDRILKVRNPPRTVARFEAYRDAVRARCRADAAGGATRAAADGNELLRFHPAALACELGADGSTSLCASCADADVDGNSAAAACGVCAAIRHGFAPWAGAHPLGVRTTASSGRAHDVCGAEAVTTGTGSSGWRAMLVCRVIAGQVHRRDGDVDGEEKEEGQEGPFDSVAGDDAGGAYGVLEELFVANPRAILPCFVVVYRVDVDAQ